MKLVKGFDEYDNKEYIDVGVKELDGNDVRIYNMGGFGGKNVSINCESGLSWASLDKLKKGIELAEKEWRK